ncbi:MAG: polyketide cyclase [Caldilinea sp. CFX5]|nr:polyketide cyclase [Caldilinea sp. CFX5]
MTTARTQANKELVWDFWQQLATANSGTVGDVVTRYHAPQIDWIGCHPFNALTTVDALVARYYQPLLHAFPELKRECYIFFGGNFQSARPEDNANCFGEWVCASGDFVGAFAHDWLGIPATGTEMRIRFGEFCRVEQGKIVGGRLILDLVDVMRLAGYRVLPPATGHEIAIPGPQSGDGVLLTPQDDNESSQSLALVEAMLFKGLAAYNQKTLTSMGNARFWTDDMRWYGPGGIGTTYGIGGFEQQHQKPFLHAFPDRKGGHHDARIAEGIYVASTGWPSLLATHAGEYLGAPATQVKIRMRVMDWWRREGDLLPENWVFIDMPDLFLQFGIDLFARLQEQIQLR